MKNISILLEIARYRRKGNKPIPTVATIILAILIVVAIFAAITGLLDQGLMEFNKAASPGGEESVIPNIG